jgi:glycolate oxidase iron-sulfur subunit
MTVQAEKPAITLDPRTYSRGLSCVHCGLCLPACPTYTQTFNEADSPRGRIQLMLALADAKIEATDSVRQHLDLCLDCRACETACPSGVVYHELIEETRAKLAPTAKPGLQVRVLRWIFSHILTHPARSKLFMLPGRLLKSLGLAKLLPGTLRKMTQMLPSEGPLWPAALPEFSPGSGKKWIEFFPGCVGSVMYDSVNRKAIELLNACGADVRVSRAQACCGAVDHHNADHHRAMELAKKNIDALLTDPIPDLIVTDIAGCGAMLRDYDFLLRDEPEYLERAKVLVSKVRDITEALVELGLPPMNHPVDATVTYHDACHLAHAQKVTSAPRQLLAQVPGLKLVPLPECDMCCGAAGTYNLTQAEMATQLAERKLKNIEMTGAKTCVAGNVGCSMHIQSEADTRGIALKVIHPVELLHEAVFGRR